MDNQKLSELAEKIKNDLIKARLDSKWYQELADQYKRTENALEAQLKAIEEQLRAENYPFKEPV